MVARIMPIVGVALAIVLFVVAAALFPGGYNWTHDYVCTLLRPAPDHPLPSAVRMPAIAAVLIYSAALGFVFYRLSLFAPSRAHKKTIQIAGIASAVYGAFAMTVIHDLVLTISFISYLLAIAAVMHWLYLRRAHSLLLLGGLSLLAQGVAAVLFYGRHFGMALSLAQKIGLALYTGWLLWTYLSLTPIEAQTPAKASNDG
jgi:hypothetical protein